MATATFDTIIQDVEKLTPEEQARLMEYLEDLADIRAADDAKAEGRETLPFNEAIAEIERERAALGIR
ncbi:MAG: hypothetical protein NVS4B8_08550 [Herpetosiphon sp.]